MKYTDKFVLVSIERYKRLVKGERKKLSTKKDTALEGDTNLKTDIISHSSEEVTKPIPEKKLSKNKVPTNLSTTPSLPKNKLPAPPPGLPDIKLKSSSSSSLFKWESIYG